MSVIINTCVAHSLLFIKTHFKIIKTHFLILLTNEITIYLSEAFKIKFQLHCKWNSSNYFSSHISLKDSICNWYSIMHLLKAITASNVLQIRKENWFNVIQKRKCRLSLENITCKTRKKTIASIYKNSSYESDWDFFYQPSIGKMLL